MPPAFLDIVVDFALFRRSAIKLPIIVTLVQNTTLPFFVVRIHTIYRLCALTYANRKFLCYVNSYNSE